MCATKTPTASGPRRLSTAAAARRQGVERSKSERVALRENRRKLLETLEGSGAIPRESISSRQSRRSRSSGRRLAERKDGDLKERRGRHQSRRMNPRRREGDEAPPRTKKSSSSDRLKKEKTTKEEEEVEEEAGARDSMTLSSFTKGIQQASSVHYTRRRRRESNLHGSFHNSFSCRELEESSGRLSGSSSRHGGSSSRRQQRRGRDRRSHGRRLRDESGDNNDDSIQVLQFDSKQSGGVSLIDANNVYSKTTSDIYADQLNSLLKDSSSGEDVTEINSSLENSLSSQVELETAADAGPLGRDSHNTEETIKQSSSSNKTTVQKTFKKMSKMLATPLASGRKAAAKTPDLFNMSIASLHI